MSDTANPNIGIRIQTEAAAAGKKKISALPFHLLLVSDLTPQAPVPADWASPSRLLHVDKNNFAEFMAQLAPRLRLEVANQLNAAPKTLELELEFPDLKAFRPESLAAQTPALAPLFQLRTLVQQVEANQLDLEAFPAAAEAAGVDHDLAARFYQLLRQQPASATPTPPAATEKTPSQGDTLDSLLGMVDFGTGPAAAPAKRTGPVEALLQAITAEEKSAVEKSAAVLLIAELDDLLGAQLNVILHHPALQRLEAAWRALKFLVDRLDFRKNIRLSVLPARRENLNEALYHQVLMPSYNGTAPELAAAPITAVIADFAFAQTSEEMAQLDDLAESMASLQAPLIAGLAPAFFGKKSGRELETLPILWQHLQRPEYVSWNALRDKPAANFLALVLPRFLLRPAYGADDPIKGFPFQEKIGADEYVWGNGALAVAAILGRNFAATGWPIPVSSAAENNRVENLPLRDYVVSGNQARIPLEVKIPETKLFELVEAGVVALKCRLNDDAAQVASAPTAHRPAKYDDTASTEEARHHATLGCQLVTTRIAQHLLSFEREIAAGLETSRLEAELVSYLQALFSASGHALAPEAVAVEISPHPERPDRCYAAFRLLVPAAILGREINVVMGLDLPRGA